MASTSTQTLTPTEREAAGKAARRRAPRTVQGRWEPGPDRPDPVEILEEQDRTRVPELISIRHGRMLASPFTFYRGAAGIMAADLGVTPRSELDVQLCGDAHLSNFGVFAAPDRRLIFDINDFDETFPGPFEWDVKRLAASFAVAGRDRGFKKSERRDVVTTAASVYREEMRKFAAERSMDVWYERLDLEVLEQYRSQVKSKVAKGFDKARAKAESKNSLRALTKLTRQEDGELRIISDPPLIVPIEELVPKGKLKAVQAGLLALIDQYRGTLSPDIRYLADRYRYVHAAHVLGERDRPRPGGSSVPATLHLGPQIENLPEAELDRVPRRLWRERSRYDVVLLLRHRPEVSRQAPPDGGLRGQRDGGMMPAR